MTQNKYNGSDATTPILFTEARANYDYVADNIAQPKTRRRTWGVLSNTAR